MIVKNKQKSTLADSRVKVYHEIEEASIRPIEQIHTSNPVVKAALNELMEMAHRNNNDKRCVIYNLGMMIAMEVE